ncbi:MAG: SDR family oxidoreductase [Pseudolabrys sp.]|nr:SDR family oxidoreductase [Pseudolabrys sp.]MDP2295749.1 SDR family oxidoreductase [Pseudolabrys sp.]
MTAKVDVVTGGAGFIGSHMVDRLLAEGRDVRVIDNFSNGTRRNLVQQDGNQHLEVVEADIADVDAIDGLFKGAERVFHFAALADIVPSIERPRDYFCANVDGTFNVLEQAKQAGVRRFLYAASSTCYGIPEIYPTPEAAPISTKYPYAVTKYLGEQLVMHWAEVYRLPAVSLRMFNVYGPRARTGGTYGAVFGVFLAQLLAGQPLTIVGDGTQTRDFTYVTDIVAAFLAAAASNRTAAVYNIGSRGTYSVNQLVKLLGAENTVHIPKRPGEPDCTFADTRKIERDLGWKAEVSFERGVQQMLSHIESWRDAPVWTPEKIGEATEGWFKYLGRAEPSA